MEPRITTDALIERLEKLERQGRRLRALCVLMAVGGAGLLAMGQAAPSPSGDWTITGPGGQKLGQLHITTEKGLSGIAIKDADGRTRTMIGVSRQGAPSVALYDESGNNRIGMGIYAGGVATVQVANSSGESRVALTNTADDQTMIAVREGIKTPRAGIFLQGGKPNVAILDAGGNPVWAAQQ